MAPFNSMAYRMVRIYYLVTYLGGNGNDPGRWLTVAFALMANPANPPSNIKAIRDERRSAFMGNLSCVFLKSFGETWILGGAFQGCSEMRVEYTVHPCFFNDLLVLSQKDFWAAPCVQSDPVFAPLSITKVSGQRYL